MFIECLLGCKWDPGLGTHPELSVHAYYQATSAIAVMLEVVLAGGFDIFDREVCHSCELECFQATVVQRVLLVTGLVDSDGWDVTRTESAIPQLAGNMFHHLPILEILRRLVGELDVKRIWHGSQPESRKSGTVT